MDSYTKVEIVGAKLAKDNMIEVDAPDKDSLSKLTATKMKDSRVTSVSYKKEKERISALVFTHANGTTFHHLDSIEGRTPCD